MRWVVFDYGKVISRGTTALPKLAAMLGVPQESFEEAYSGERRAYDDGCSDLEYWQAIGARLGVEVGAELAAELAATDTLGWSELDSEALLLIKDLHEAGVMLALLSNAPSSFGRSVEQRSWARSFAHLVFSGDLRMSKPDAGIYRALLELIEAEPGECVFFDDRQENVEAAACAGLSAHLWCGAAEARQELRAHGLRV